MRILVNGADGFVGRALANYLARESGWTVCGTCRSIEAGADLFSCDVTADGGWMDSMRGVDAVVHLAARAHKMNDNVRNPLREYRRTNSEGAVRVARFAKECGVRRFVFMSTVKVLGEVTEIGKPFDENAPINPQDPYSISKAEAEELLADFHDPDGFQVVVVRPPLVYGQGVKGNLKRLVSLADAKIPLPLGAIENRRDLVGVDNLCSFIKYCLRTDLPNFNRFLVSDDHRVSTRELYKTICKVRGTNPMTPTVPAGILEAMLLVLGKKGLWRRISDSLEVDIEHSKKVLNWAPGISFEDGMHAAFRRIQ